jgi:hypothetical protein
MQVLMGFFAAHRSQVIVLIFSLSFGLWFITPRNVWPTSVGWLNYGDMAFAQYMWQYFRETPILQWPITAVDSYGDAWETIFPSTAGIVLVGLPLKLVSPLLPETFQYLGLWTLANFGLQGIFAERLFARFGLGVTERIFGATSVVLAPAFLFRVGMTHLDLAAHWIILAALLVYFSGDTPRVRTATYVLSMIALLINIYLFVIIFLIAVATLVKRCILSEHDHRQKFCFLRQFVILSTLSGLMWWILGYSTFLGSARGEGFFRINLLGFFNAGYGFSESFSRLRDSMPMLSSRTFFAQEGEGFAYLGLVGLCGVAALLPLMPKWSERRNLLVAGPIVVTAGLLFLVALSDRIAIARREVFLPVPEALIQARQIFRVANRFSWVAYYLILVLGWVGLCQILRRFRIGPLLLAGLLVVSGIDQWPGVSSVRATFLSGSSLQSSFRSPEWSTLGSSVSRMYLSPTFDAQEDELPDGAENWLAASRMSDLVRFGAENQLVTNFAYVGRPVTQQVESANEWLQSALESGSLPSESIIFFARESDWRKAQERISGDFLAKTLDGYFIIVTNGGG